ncbi:hypothetical protein CAPTEDRAFT_194734 [Capitella teleta]|uniref:Tetraspanin n=1 Tax=Capitella teleta TaxID=283909 RepID=R7VCH8_CAPTE|nr:hypothetical protein CAPTEDRAFT_194734 [Capitella teleta]|eukprot:ELU16247.1 hypothetical protein CAPTEDRAFT_194734 [Capitella teleta]
MHYRGSGEFWDFQLLLKLTGAVILGVSIWVKVDPSIVQYIEVLSVDQNDPLWQTATVLLVAVGAFIFVVGFIGCCGACKESPCLLWLYIAFLVLIFIAEVAAAIFAIVFKRDLLKVLDKTLSKQAKVYVEDKYQKTAPINLAWHAMQVNLECCGGHSYVDFIESPYFNKTVKKLPSSQFLRNSRTTYDESNAYFYSIHFI